MSNKNSNSQLECIIQISGRLNLSVKSYLEKTMVLEGILKKLVDRGEKEVFEEDGLVFKLNEVLEQREVLIHQFNELNQEYNRLTKVLDRGHFQQLELLAEERRQTFETIKDADNNNMQMMRRLHDNSQGKIKKVEEGKKLHKAYQHTNTLSDGIFIDKRK
ncbi:MAG: hypothetical protein C4550_02830 [Nitrospiraceae bacterium]|nr:MAG: hypothetical protein C4550_02830 [Nitrospiraceae bacterium]